MVRRRGEEKRGIEKGRERGCEGRGEVQGEGGRTLRVESRQGENGERGGREREEKAGGGEGGAGLMKEK